MKGSEIDEACEIPSYNAELSTLDPEDQCPAEFNYNPKQTPKQANKGVKNYL